MTKFIRIWDIDGVLIDSSHRCRWIGGKFDLDYWRANEHKLEQDQLLPAVTEYRRQLANPEIFVAIATARQLQQRDYNFISGKLGQPDAIISRALGDNFTKGGAQKIAGIKAAIEINKLNHIPPQNVVFYEDNKNYLDAVCGFFGFVGVHVQSKQGY